MDLLVDDWARHDATADMRATEVVQRVQRLGLALGRRIDENLTRHDLSRPTLAALSVLVRSESEAVSQRLLGHRMGLTGGTVSVRVDRLVADGLVERLPDPDDARGVLVRVTDLGRRVFAVVTPSHLQTMQEALASLTEPQRAMLADLLRRVLLGLERDVEPSPTRFGIRVAAAPAALRLQSATGLPPVPGLLVAEVEPGAVAEQGGLAIGDVLTHLEGRELRSVLDLELRDEVTVTARRPGRQAREVVLRAPASASG